MEMKCVQINYNWYYTSDSDEYNSYKVGEGGVTRIDELHDLDTEQPPGTYVIEFDDERFEVIYNPNKVFYKPVKKENEFKNPQGE